MSMNTKSPLGRCVQLAQGVGTVMAGLPGTSGLAVGWTGAPSPRALAEGSHRDLEGCDMAVLLPRVLPDCRCREQVWERGRGLRGC